MISLDTNVLVRFLVQDDAKQTARAKRALENQIKQNEVCLVTLIVLVECVWVLESCYRLSRVQIVSTLRKLLSVPELKFVSVNLLYRAVEAYASGRGDFADYLIREQSLKIGASTVITFDKVLHKEPGFSTV